MSADHFSPELRDFVRQCLHRDPQRRQPADILLGAPFLQRWGAVSYESSVGIVREWIEGMTPRSYKK